MNWFHAPFDPMLPLWFGIQVFWWRRVFGFLQTVSGGSVLAILLTEQHKIWLHQWFANLALGSADVKIPSTWRIRDLLKWMIPTALAVAAMLAGSGVIHLHTGHQVGALPVFIISSVILLYLTIPIAVLAAYASFVFSAYRVGKKFIPPALEWTFHPKRFDRSVAVISFVMFLAASLGQLYLS